MYTQSLSNIPNSYMHVHSLRLSGPQFLMSKQQKSYSEEVSDSREMSSASQVPLSPCDYINSMHNSKHQYTARVMKYSGSPHSSNSSSTDRELINYYGTIIDPETEVPESVAKTDSHPKHFPAGSNPTNHRIETVSEAARRLQNIGGKTDEISLDREGTNLSNQAQEAEENLPIIETRTTNDPNEKSNAKVFTLIA